MIQDPTPSKKPYVILAALTLDDTGLLALHEAVRLSQVQPDSELHVVYVAPEARDTRAAREDEPELSPAQLAEYVNKACDSEPRHLVAHVRVGAPSRAIVRTAAELDAELVVVGARRSGRTRKLTRGSVAEQVFLHAHCPVFVALPKDHPSPASARSLHTGCPRCIDARKRSYGEQAWCERHARARSSQRSSGAMQLPDRMHYHP